MDPVMRSTTRNTTQWYWLGDATVTPTVASMTYQRLPYEDAAPTTEMISDCAAVERALHLPSEGLGTATALPERHGVEEVVVPDSLADLAREMQLHLH
jgi:hypothetical protein